MSQLDATLWIIAIWMLIITAFFIHRNSQNIALLDFLEKTINQFLVKVGHKPIIKERRFKQQILLERSTGFSYSGGIGRKRELSLTRERYLKLTEIAKKQDKLPQKLRKKIINEYQNRVKEIDNILKTEK